MNKYPMLKNRSEKMKNLKIQTIKVANESFHNRITKLTGSIDLKKLEKDYEQNQTYKKIRIDRSKFTPQNKKRLELSPFDRKV